MIRLLVISDSSSLIIGTMAGLLNVLCKEFHIQIPEKVFEETVTAGKELQKIDALKIEEAIEEKKIVVKKITPLKQGKASKWLSQLNLDEGEIEAIKLYIQTKAKLLLADDRQAINAAKLLEINWTTIPDIIVGFAERKKISREDALQSLKIAQKEGRYKIDFILKAFNRIENIKGGKK
jgi:predicted nucleic acid-binding protein